MAKLQDVLSQVHLGARVQRATAAIPQSTTGHIFNVVGGRVLVRMLLGEVTTIIQAQATTIKVTATPTAGSAVDMSATVDINALEVGGKLVLNGTAATALTKANAGSIIAQSTSVVVAVGTIDLITVASSTGALKWSIWYMPLDDGASITAA